MRAPKRFAALLAALFVAGAAQAAPREVTVVIDDYSFTPAETEVAAGGRITWLNKDDTPHTVNGTDTPRPLRSPALDTGDSFTYSFDQPGTFHYFCRLHPRMTGTVVVR